MERFMRFYWMAFCGMYWVGGVIKIMVCLRMSRLCSCTVSYDIVFCKEISLFPLHLIAITVLSLHLDGGFGWISSELPSQERSLDSLCELPVLCSWRMGARDACQKDMGYEGLLILLLWVCSPRVCGSLLQCQRHSFCITVIFGVDRVLWIEKKTILRTIVHAAVIALLMNTRILGVLVLIYSALLGVQAKRTWSIFGYVDT